ncbi:hypothetical protein ACSBLW_11425 [Thioclava sp. FR2]|uniref:hypothetical protein n=1 Tax=Thioclava sp. FR2 TaxID=3445780 RepID=UPI003EBA6300
MRLSVLILLAALGPGPTQAEEFISDGFGLVPRFAAGEERGHWSGLQGSENNEMFSTSLVMPEAVDTVMVLFGPKSLVAGQDEGHGVSIAVDRHGNLAADGLAVEFRLGDETRAGNPTRYGIGDLIFAPATRSGTYAAGAEVDSRQSPRALFRVTADLRSVELNIAPQPQVEPEQILPLATEPLRDRYGNPVEDGTALMLLVEHPSEASKGPGGEVLDVSVLSARSVGGVGHAEILTRDMPPEALAQMVLATSRSATRKLDIAQVRLAHAPELRLWAREDTPELRLRVGPLVTDAGHLLYEGAEIALRITAPDQREVSLTGWASDGYLWIDVPMAAQDAPYRIVIESAFGSSEATLSPGPAPRDARKELVQ